MKSGTSIVATDLGAESGRVVLCRWTGEEGILEEVHRFPNGARQEAGHLVWDLDRLWQEVLKGLRLTVSKAGGRIASVGVDGWGVDYVLLDRTGNRIGRAYCYRDARNLPQMERAFTLLPQKRMYEITGIQFLPFNTVFQLMAHAAEFPSEWDRAAKWLTLPEYFLFRLSGVAMAEYTEASTTQLLDVYKRSWSEELTRALGLNLEKFPPIAPPGTPLGKMRKELATDLGLSNVQVIAPACHDTGAAVAGIPFPHDKLAFISSGTWSLVGTVLLNPVVMWGGWWLVLAVFFSAGTYLNSYYVAALVPAVAALCGTGIAAVRTSPLVGQGAADRCRDGARLRRLRRLPDVRDGIRPDRAHRGGAGRGGGRRRPAAAARVRPGRVPDRDRVRRCRRAPAAAAASVSCVIDGLGPFDTPVRSRRRPRTLTSCWPPTRPA